MSSKFDVHTCLVSFGIFNKDCSMARWKNPKVLTRLSRVGDFANSDAVDGPRIDPWCQKTENNMPAVQHLVVVQRRNYCPLMCECAKRGGTPLSCNDADWVRVGCSFALVESGDICFAVVGEDGIFCVCVNREIKM